MKQLPFFLTQFCLGLSIVLGIYGYHAGAILSVMVAVVAYLADKVLMPLYDGLSPSRLIALPLLSFTIGLGLMTLPFFDLEDPELAFVGFVGAALCILSTGPLVFCKGVFFK